MTLSPRLFLTATIVLAFVLALLVLVGVNGAEVSIDARDTGWNGTRLGR